MVASYSISRIILEIPSGYISLKYGYYLPMSMGLFLMAAGSFLCAFTGHPLHLVLARMLIGLGSPLFFTTFLGFIIKLFEPLNQGRALGIFKAIHNVAAVLGSLAIGYFITAMGFRWSYIFSGELGFAALLLILFPSSIRSHTEETYDDLELSSYSLSDIVNNKNILIL